MTKAEFESQVWPLRSKLYRIALYMLRDEDLACDAVQDIFMKIWEKRNSLNNVKNIEAFLVTSIKNRCLDKLKSGKREVYNGENHLILHAGYETPASPNNAFADAIKHVKKFVSELPEKQRLIMQLRDLEGLEIDEISDITGMNSGTIRVNLSRARSTIRDKLTFFKIIDPDNIRDQNS